MRDRSVDGDGPATKPLVLVKGELSRRMRRRNKAGGELICNVW